MKNHSLPIRTAWSLLIAAGLLMSFVNQGDAATKVNVGGVTVSYSGTGMMAYYYPPDGTLTVEVPPGVGGSLTITVGSTAYLAWGNYVDIYLLADYSQLKSISIKGHATCTPFVIGQVGFVNKFALSKGVVGGTDYYGYDFGLGMVAPYIPAAISLKQSYAMAQIFGYAYSKPAAARSAGDARDSAAKGEETQVTPQKREAGPEKAALIQRVQSPAD